MRERRREQRLRSYLGGEIAFLRRRVTADCIIRNTSDSGAKLIVQNGRLVPDEFELTIPRQQADYRARTRWRRVDEIGVELELMHESDAPIPLAWARKLKRLEAENAGLRRQLGEAD